MKNISREFKNQLNNGNRRYIKSATISLKDGTTLKLDDSNFWENGIKLESAVSSDNSFDIGSVIIGQLTVVINNIYDDYSDCDFTDAVVSNVKIGLKLPDESIESLAYGKFTVNEAVYNGSIITLICYDNIYKFDRPYSESKLKYPATLGEIVRDCCSVCGVDLGTATFDNDNFVVQNRPIDEAITFRNVLQWVGQISCNFCKADEHGRLVLKWYDILTLDRLNLLDGGDFSPWTQGEHVSGGTFKPWSKDEILSGGTFGDTEKYHYIYATNSLTLTVDDVVITGVKVIEEVEAEEGVKTESYLAGKDGYVLEIKGNKLIQGAGKTVGSLLGEKLIGLRFRSFSASCLSNPAIEAGDVALLEDRKGNIYKTLITSNIFQPGNFQQISCGAEAPARKSASRYSAATQAYVEYRKNIEKERTDREAALEELKNRIDNSDGAFTTIEEQSNGGKIFYLHNKPKLEDSDMVWKMTTEAWGVSTDGGKTYNAGMTVDGDTIVRILTAIGVNADWIKAGAIQVNDKEGNVIFKVDMDTKEVTISGDNITIGGKTAAELIGSANKTANEALEEAKNSKALNMVLSNEYQGIPTDANGKYTSFPECETVVTVLWGSFDISESVTYSVTKSSGITGSWNSATRTYTVTGLSTDTGWVDIKATYLNALSVTKRFDVVKQKQGEQGEKGQDGNTYILEPSVSLVKLEKDNVTHVEYISFNAYIRVGASTTREPYAGRFKIEETADGVEWREVYVSTENESTVDYFLATALTNAAGKILLNKSNKVLTIPRFIYSIRCTLYAAGGTSQLLDTQEIPVVRNVKSFTQEEIFNILTDDGAAKGLYKVGNQLYISFTYARGGTLVLGGADNENGLLEVLDENREVIGRIDKDGIMINGVFRATDKLFGNSIVMDEGYLALESEEEGVIGKVLMMLYGEGLKKHKIIALRAEGEKEAYIAMDGKTGIVWIQAETLRSNGYDTKTGTAEFSDGSYLKILNGLVIGGRTADGTEF